MTFREGLTIGLILTAILVAAYLAVHCHYHPWIGWYCI